MFVLRGRSEDLVKLGFFSAISEDLSTEPIARITSIFISLPGVESVLFGMAIYECLDVGEGTYKSSFTMELEVETSRGNIVPFIFENEVEKTIQCVEPGTIPSPTPTPTPTPDDGGEPKADFDIEIFPEEESPEGALDFTHFFNVTDCPQKIAEIKITNTGTQEASIIVDTPSSSIDFRIKGEGPPSIPKLTLELDPNEMITIEVFFNCDTTQSFDTTIFIDGVLLQAGGSVPGSGMSRSVMVDGTIVIP